MASVGVRRAAVLMLLVAQVALARGCRSPNSIELFNQSDREVTYVAEEGDHGTVGAAPPDVVLPAGAATAWAVRPNACLEGVVEARDGDGYVVASWSQPCGGDQLRVAPS